MKHNEVRFAIGSVKKKTRKGRGNASGQGGECGRGHKGQKSRTGGSVRPGFEGGQTPLYRRLPKKRGFRNAFKVSYFALNLDTIEKHFKAGDIVNSESLVKAGVLGSETAIKILGRGDLTKNLVIKAQKFSESAIEKIKKVGATAEVVS